MSPTKDDIGTIARTPKDDFSEAGVIIREVEEGTRCEECQNVCGGYSPHEWRKTCQSCKCPREAHAIYQEQVTSVRERLGFKPESQTSRIDPRQLGYTWVPPGIMTSAKVQRYFDKIPQEKVPKVGTSGERYRERQITLQLPKQDLALDLCKHVEPQHRASYEDFVAARNEIALDIGYIKDAPQSTKCVNCDDRITKGDLAVIAPKFRDQMMWHPKCFSCATCDELLVDLTYCVHEEKIYCERHYAELLKPRCNACDEAKKSTERDDVENVSNDDAEFQPEQLIASHDRKPSTETDDQVACNNPDDETERKSLRRSPRLDDMDHYEERLREEEIAKLRALSSSAQSPKNNDFSTSQLTEHHSEITSACSTDEQNLSANTTKTDEISSIGKEHLRGNSPRTFDRAKTPTIEIEPALDDNNNNSTEPSSDQNEFVSEPGLLEGISDFYDFNASINPSRSPSVERVVRKSRSPSGISREPSEERSKLPENDQPHKDMKPIPYLSDFYDFNVMMNQQAYGYESGKDRDVHLSTTDYLAEKLKTKKLKSKSPAPISLPKNEDPCLPEESGGTTSNTFSPLDTPEYLRTISANMRYVESKRDEFRKNMYQRSRYVGESMDFENDFEELREQTRHFRRSRSKSRSPIPEEGEPSTSRQAELAAARRELQDKILDEITRTTINYQDFSRDFNKPFLDFDRRVSDSALIQKPEIMFQIEDECKERSSCDDDNDDLDGDEYHHFRRFSLNQEHQIEEYPDTNNYIYVEEIEVQTPTGTRSWVRRDYCDPEVKSNPEISEEMSPVTIDDVTGEDSDRGEADDSESEDDRQTVVEVDDEIDEDIWDYDRPEESNDQSECEEAEREMDRYANKNADDWNEDGAIGGVDHDFEIHNFKEDTINIDEMYDDAVKNTGESGIEKDYDIIVKAMNDEENEKTFSSNELSDSVSVKTEDLLDEILREDEKRYKRSSPRIDKWETTRSFIEHESTAGASSQNGVSPTAISSTRLRSRYGLAPSTAHRNFDSLENINVDLSYIPKKEYKWRKNFKLDDDDAPQDGSLKSDDSRKNKQNEEEDVTLDSEALFPKNAEECESPGSTEVNSFSTEEISEENEIGTITKNKEVCDTPTTEICKQTEEKICDEIPPEKSENQEMVKIDNLVESVENKTSRANESKETELLSKPSEESEVPVKKKKTKRRIRKGSKGSIGEGEALQNVEPVDVEGIETQKETGAKKKTKKKKKSVTSPDIQTRSSSPAKTDFLSSTNLNTQAKSISPSAVEKVIVLNSEEANKDASVKNEEVPKSSVYLAATTSQSKSKSRSPELVKSTGPNIEHSGTTTSPKPQLERNDSTGVYELIKDGSMYPWF